MEEGARQVAEGGLSGAGRAEDGPPLVSPNMPGDVAKDRAALAHEVDVGQVKDGVARHSGFDEPA